MHYCRFRVIAAGIDYKDRIISLKTNTPRLPNRGMHAEERVIFSSPRSLERIVIARIGARGDILPIDPCARCNKLAAKRGITIERIGVR